VIQQAMVNNNRMDLTCGEYEKGLPEWFLGWKTAVIYTGGAMDRWFGRARKAFAGFIWPDYPKVEDRYRQLTEAHQGLRFHRARLEAKLRELECNEPVSPAAREAFRGRLAEIKGILDEL
jgi:hypothetical protein